MACIPQESGHGLARKRMLGDGQAIDEEVALLTWPDFDVPPQLRAVGSAGGDRRGGGGTERAEAQAEEHKRVVGPVHVQKAWSAEMKVSARASPGVAGVCLYSLGRLPCVL